MATTYITVTDWQLGYIDPSRENGGKQPAGVDSEAESGYEWVRDQYTVVLYRDGASMSSFLSRIGDQADGSAITWNRGDGTTLAGRSSFTYRCIDNMIQPLAPNIVRETIVWQWRSNWEEIILPDYPSPYIPD